MCGFLRYLFILEFQWYFVNFEGFEDYVGHLEVWEYISCFDVFKGILFIFKLLGYFDPFRGLGCFIHFGAFAGCFGYFYSFMVILITLEFFGVFVNFEVLGLYWSFYRF